MTRPSWDDYFKEIVQVTATRSPCERLHVGCLLISDHRIVSQGYNGFLPGCDHCSIIREGHEQATVHAEQNALMCCARLGIPCDGASLYITHYPCINCFKSFVACGIKKIIYLHDYKNDVNIEKIIETMDEKIEIIKLVS
jgi:dCMP deaminase